MGQAKQRGTYEQRKQIAIEARKVIEGIEAQKRQERIERLKQEQLMSRARMNNGKVVVGSSSQMGGLSHNNYHDRLSLSAGLGAIVVKS